jgi:hypothetical protein
MRAQATENRGMEVEAGQVSEAATAPAPQGAAPAAPAGRYVVRGDPREDEAAFDRFTDLLKAAYYESVERGVVLISFYGSEDEVWPPTLILSQPFGMSIAKYAVVQDEDKRPLYVFDVFEQNWGFVADTVLQIAAQHFGLEKILWVEIEVSERW